MFWRFLLALATLTIGTATTRIDLLNPWGFHVEEWRPQALDHTGTWQESSLSDFSQQVDYKYINTTDTFTMKARQRTQDALIYETQELRRILQAAIDYWKPGSQGECVYLEAQASCETNTRYAKVKDGRLVDDDNPYRQPMTGWRTAGMEDLSLIITHGPWEDNVPGESDCVQISGTQQYENRGIQLFWSGSPGQASDDVWSYGSQATYASATTFLPLGNLTSGGTYVGIRFPNVAVPAGATIIDAYVQFRANQTDGNTDSKVIIRGHDTGNSATFASWSDYITRFRTTAYVLWPGWGDTTIERWTVGNDYVTPQLRPIIREIIGNATWASGNGLTLFFEDNGSDTNAVRRASSWDHAIDPAPILYITYRIAGDYDYGRDETCLNEVYVANKHNRANLTDIYTYQAIGPVWSVNQLGVATPFNLLPNPVANNDAVYFGIDSTLVDSGPFCSLIFDISTAAVYTGNATITWEYWSSLAGPGWRALNFGANPLRDHTNNGTGPFSNTGVNGVFWQQPSDWVTNAAAPGVGPITGYWVRALVSIPAPPGDSITTPQQDNRDVYSVVWPYVTLDSDEVEGDMAALSRIRVHGQSTGFSGYTPSFDLSAHRVLVGLRSTWRGDNFSAYLNAADEQNPVGVTVSPDADTAVATDSTTPTGRRYRYTPSAANDAVRLRWSFAHDLSIEYRGIYHAFLRARQNGGAGGQFVLQLSTVAGWGGVLQTSPERVFDTVNDWQVIDFGRLEFPPRDALSETEVGDVASILLWIENDTFPTANTVDIYDLVLIPADEWIGDFYASTDYFALNLLGWQRVLDIDSITFPKRNIRAPLKVETSEEVTDIWTPSAKTAIWQPNQEQRLWFFTIKYETSTERRSEPWNANSIQAFAVQRYFSMRGDR